jgi:hypothetical protein
MQMIKNSAEELVILCSNLLVVTKGQVNKKLANIFVEVGVQISWLV